MQRVAEKVMRLDDDARILADLKAKEEEKAATKKRVEAREAAEMDIRQSITGFSEFHEKLDKPLYKSILKKLSQASDGFLKKGDFIASVRSDCNASDEDVQLALLDLEDQNKLMLTDDEIIVL